MKSQLDNYLVTKYPKIFINRYEDMKSTAMCFGFECGDGWFWLVDNLCETIQSYIDNNHHNNIPQVVAQQVKEKFGGLRFYIDGGDEKIHGMIWLAEHMSYNICEECGATENLGRTTGWIKTLCATCANSPSTPNSLKWKKNEDLKLDEITKELRKIKMDKIKAESSNF